MPEEILIIVLFLISAGTLLSLMRMFLGYRERRQGSAHQAGSTMTTSELERMMRQAVSEATSSIEKKIEDLEFELATRKNSPELERVRTDLLVEPDDRVEDREEIRQTTRTRS